ncbi:MULTISPECIES: hypothetical protein [Actinomadura]|uniref:hypothetical protein n=1 Tax=Actinomadura TaxID=1988 RepID=UPI00040F612A|nr:MULTISPECIES: hypothetical protein [Actinomadura]RSN66795.1 hypothetical protein DMH08_15445 [Actinomadura sp. WAC 06369]
MARDSTVPQVHLPLTGWTVRLDDAHLVVNPGGSPLTHHVLAQPILGAHRVRLARPFGPSAVDTVTVAYGTAPGTVVLARHRPWRPARLHEVRPVMLADRVWVVEQPGRYDEVRVGDAVRLL